MLVVGVAAGASMSFLAGEGVPIHVVDVADHGSQFRSRDVFPEALAALARAFTAETGVRAHLRVVGSENASLPPRLESELLRIAQEALANVRRHAAGAAEVAITLHIRADAVRLTLRDDGQGFDTAQVVPATSHGIVGMRERAKLLNGTLRIRSRAGRGTTVTASVPLPQGEISS